MLYISHKLLSLRSSTYYFCEKIDLKKYINFNQFYLFSNIFHLLVLIEMF